MSDFRPLRRLHVVGVFFFALFLLPSILSAQVTTGAMSGVVTSTDGEAVVAEASGTGVGKNRTFT
jgi:hypothetical protein